MSLVDRTATELVSQLTAGEVTSAELVDACLSQIEARDSSLHAFLRVDADAARQRAAEIDQRRKDGQPVGLLAGLPVGLKDVLCTRGEPTTCGSRMLENFRPPYDAAVVARLKAADAVLIGKTNMDEFAMGSSTENSAFGLTRNPWNPDCTPGGSSGGSAAAVAARMVPLSIGTDTGGSIRQPAAFCGVTGLKPTYGRVSRFGLVAFASSLDQVGPFARTAEDAALLLEAIAGHDPRDATSIDQPVPSYRASVRQPLEGLTLGVAREHFDAGLDSEVESAVREAIRVYESLGAKVREISLKHGKYGVAVYYIIAPAEASSNLARYDGCHYGYRTDEKNLDDPDDDGKLVAMYRQTRAEGFGPEVKRRVMLGTYTLSKGYYDAYYVKALKVRRLIREDYDAAFGEVDLIIGPCTPAPAFKLGEKVDDPLSMYLGDLYTVTGNLAGVAGISIPCGFTSAGLPIGLQLQSAPLAEEKLLRAACMFQQATDWHEKAPS